LWSHQVLTIEGGILTLDGEDTWFEVQRGYEGPRGRAVRLELRAAFELFRVIYGAHVGAVRKGEGSCSTGNGALFVAPQKGVQHRQTDTGLSGKFLDVGSSYRKGWELARETDQCISGAHVGVASAFRNKGVSANEKYDGEANSQDQA
jgi:hypothetical protein